MGKEKAKTRKGKAYLARVTEGVRVEPPKRLLLMKGPKASAVITDVLTDLHMMHKPHSHKLRHNNQIRPFSDQSSVEFLTRKNECGLFAIGSHSKKRPHNLTVGRIYNNSVLDMYEFGISQYVSFEELSKGFHSYAEGDLPLLVFLGDAFQVDILHQKLANFFVDFFGGIRVDAVNLMGLSRVIVISALRPATYDGKPVLRFRQYRTILLKSGMSTPITELQLIGPSMELTLGRVEEADKQVWRQAIQQPKEVTQGKTKNIEQSVYGKMGRVHKESQDTQSIQTRKIKALKRERSEKRFEARKRQQIDA